MPTDQIIDVDLGTRSYPIHCGDSFATLADVLTPFVGGRRCALVTTPVVQPLYAETVMNALRTAGATPTLILMPDGEQHKTLGTAEQLLRDIAATGLTRTDHVVALGGGVVGDVAGFAAGVYMRGIPFVQIPTTLLAQVDSSVGGKTGVNLPHGKNLVGVFHQPACVFINWAALRTLPPREFRAGFAEVIKYGVIAAAPLFAELEAVTPHLMQAVDTHTSLPAALGGIIRECCAIKARVVAADEREGGLRAILNYGHTFGHAIEQLTGYGVYLHGEAVAMGMHTAAVLAYELGLVPSAFVRRQRALLEAAGLPAQLPALDPDAVCAAFARDKKARGSELRFVLPRAIGTVEVISNPPAESLRKALRSAHGT